MGKWAWISPKVCTILSADHEGEVDSGLLNSKLSGIYCVI